MAWTDRDYYRREAPMRFPFSWGRMRSLSVTAWLIIINVAVFVIDSLLTRQVVEYIPALDQLAIVVRRPLEQWGHFSWFRAIDRLELWRFVTFQFLHANFTHLLFNMFGLYFFGGMVEQYLGRTRYIAFYLVCGVAGAAAYLVLSATHVLVESPYTPLVGASAGIFGILVAAAMIAPDTVVMLLFPPIPMRLRVMAWVMVGIGAVTVITGGQNAGGQAAHLGGAVVGWVLIRRPAWLTPWRWRRRPRMRYRPDDWA